MEKGRRRTPFKLDYKQIFSESNPPVFTPTGSEMFAIYLTARTLEKHFSGESKSNLAEQQLNELSDNFNQLKVLEGSELSLSDFIKQFVQIAQPRCPEIKLNGQLSGKWDILPRKKKSKLTNLLELLKW